MQDLGARLEEVVGRLLAEQRARYSLVVDSTAWTLVDGAVRVEGAVLVASQATAYQQAIAAALPDLATADVPRPTVLTELDTPFDAVRWASVRGDDAVDLHSGPEGADLQTQWTPPAAVRLFSSRGARALVQLPDGTVGWVDADRLVPAAPEEDPWRDLRRAPAGAVTEADGPLSAAASCSPRTPGTRCSVGSGSPGTASLREISCSCGGGNRTSCTSGWPCPARGGSP